jgi:hypothetical protein
MAAIVAKGHGKVEEPVFGQMIRRQVRRVVVQFRLMMNRLNFISVGIIWMICNCV